MRLMKTQAMGLAVKSINKYNQRWRHLVCLYQANFSFLHFIFRPEAFIISYRSKQNILEEQVKFIQALADFSNQFNTFITFHALHLVFYRYFNLQSNLGASAVLLQSPPQGASTSSPNNWWYMVKKQDSPRQLHILREVKRKAQADQEARLQQSLARISQQDMTWCGTCRVITIRVK